MRLFRNFPPTSEFSSDACASGDERCPEGRRQKGLDDGKVTSGGDAAAVVADEDDEDDIVEGDKLQPCGGPRRNFRRTVPEDAPADRDRARRSIRVLIAASLSRCSVC